MIIRTTHGIGEGQMVGQLLLLWLMASAKVRQFLYAVYTMLVWMPTEVKRWALDPLELEIQVAVSQMKWLLGTEKQALLVIA